jgi:hypothetical protein
MIGAADVWIIRAWLVGGIICTCVGWFGFGYWVGRLRERRGSAKP